MIVRRLIKKPLLKNLLIFWSLTTDKELIERTVNKNWNRVLVSDLNHQPLKNPGLLALNYFLLKLTLSNLIERAIQSYLLKDHFLKLKCRDLGQKPWLENSSTLQRKAACYVALQEVFFLWKQFVTTWCSLFYLVYLLASLSSNLTWSHWSTYCSIYQRYPSFSRQIGLSASLHFKS
jgi:hypothetical protein